MRTPPLLQKTLLASLLALGGAVTHGDVQAASLVVGDTAAAKVYVYNLPDLKLTAQFDNIVVGAHAGIIMLPDGRALIPDEVGKQLIAVKIGAESQASIVGTSPMPIPLEVRYGWAAVDPQLKHYFTTSDDHDDAIELLSIVDLDTYKGKQIKVSTKGPADAEVGVVAGGEPAMVILHLAEQAETYPLAALLDAKTKLASLLSKQVEPSSTLAIGPGGHANSFSPPAGAWLGATLRGMETARLTGKELGNAALAAWDVDGRKGGRNARQRLTADGMHAFGTLNAAVPPEKWAETEVDLHWVDLKSGAAKRLPLARGLVGRGGVSSRYAVYANVHPDGDFANLIDVDPASPAFRTVAARVPLDRLSKGPVAGQSPAGTQSRHSTISPDGRWAFVSHGGDGTISVIDTEKRQVIQKITTPTPLSGGGYLSAITPGSKLFELSAR